MERFIAVEIQKFRGTMRDLTFDVFLKVSGDHYAHVFSRSTGVDYQRLEKYIFRGVKELYIRENDYEIYKNYSKVTAATVFTDPALTQEKRVSALLNMTEQNLAEIFTRFSVDEQAAQQSRTLVQGYVGLMSSEPQTLAMILKLVSYGNYLYYHAVAVSVFSLLLARALGQFDSKLLEIIGMGGFLHDIGRTQLPQEINESARSFTPEEWKIMRSHPKLGLDMLQDAKKIPDEVRYIVYQHHEQPGGGGYPNALRGPVIYPPARIVSICDSFSALISARPFRKAYSVDEALKIMQGESGKFDKILIQTMRTVFAHRLSEPVTPTGQAA